MKDKEQTQKIFILCVVIFLIILLVIGFIVRYTVFKTGKYLTTLPESELIKQGYGVYSNVFSTGCLTASGKCSTAGVKYTTQYCVPNKDTGKGCLTQEGQLTFASQTIVENCLPNCRSNILEDVSSTTEYIDNASFCKYPPPYNGEEYLCVPRNIRADQYSIFNCNPNDPVGENSCNYVCGTDGIGPNGVSGDSDPTLPSYIPNCVGKKGNIITLNSFNWNLVGNIPNKGFTITKGYTIYNLIETNNDGSTGPSYNLFFVDPPYLPPATKNNPLPFPMTTITRKELAELDTQLVVLENCTPIAPKPECQNLFTYTPIEVGGSLTTSNNKFKPSVPPNTVLTKQCYVQPYWNATPVGPTGAISNYVNPFEVLTSNIGAYNMLSGIGGYGITYEYEACLPGNASLVSAGFTGTTELFFMPNAYTSEYQCPLLTASVTGPSNTTCYVDNNYIPLSLNVGANYSICDTVFPDGTRPVGWNGTNVPGLITPCQYLPESDTLDFSGETTGGIILNSALQDLLGKYIQFNAIDITVNQTYFLSLTTSPCGTGTNSSDLIPLSNCSAINSDSTNGYQSQKCMYIYTGGDLDSGSAGGFWDRLNCDGEMIGATSSINMIISPRTVNSSTSLTCDLYGTFGSIFGQFYTELDGLNHRLYFQPMTSSERLNPLYYRTQTFDLTYDTMSSQLEIHVTGDLTTPIYVDSFDGTSISDNVFEISNYTGNIQLSPYKIPFYGPVIKQGGINADSDIRNTLENQRNDQCYYDSCNPDVPSLTNPCFPKTCNIYYEYNSNIC